MLIKYYYRRLRNTIRVIQFRNRILRSNHFVNIYIYIYKSHSNWPKRKSKTRWKMYRKSNYTLYSKFQPTKTQGASLKFKELPRCLKKIAIWWFSQFPSDLWRRSWNSNVLLYSRLVQQASVLKYLSLNKWTRKEPSFTFINILTK